VPWQPHAGISKKLSSRGYATTSWTTEEAADFADLGYPAKPSGFSADHYQPMKQPLTKQAQASLALLEGEYRNEAFGEEKPESQTSASTNEHLPFVVDSFGASRKSKLRVNVDAGVLKRAMAHAAMAETLEVSPITSDDAEAEPIVIHPDTPDAPDGPHTLASELTLQEAPPVVHEATVDVMAPVVPSISAEEVTHREAEQFAKGRSQAREEAEAEFAQALEKAKAEALAQGLEQGKAEGLTQGHAQGLAEGLEQGLEKGRKEGWEEGHKEGLEQGKAEGLTEGEQQAREAAAEEMAAQRLVFEAAAKELHALIELVVGELQTSAVAVERLVQRCLDALDHPVQGAVVLELNPADKERLQSLGPAVIQGMRLEAMHDMKPGSVRVFANDTVVEDLVEHRLVSLAQALQVDEAAWRDKSPLMAPELDVEEKAEDGDVHS
jgi:flagellar biosynthesis/type III secretory pathway protein FliH